MSLSGDQLASSRPGGLSFSGAQIAQQVHLSAFFLPELWNTLMCPDLTTQNLPRAPQFLPGTPQTPGHGIQSTFPFAPDSSWPQKAPLCSCSVSPLKELLLLTFAWNIRVLSTPRIMKVAS